MRVTCHQIPLSSEISHYFALKFKERDLTAVRSGVAELANELPSDWNGSDRLRGLRFELVALGLFGMVPPQIYG
jgi:hypothetical protein